MPILIDEYGHLASTDGEEDLHRFAARLGLRRSWFQARKDHPHYDVTSAQLQSLAIRLGAERVFCRKMLYLMGKAGLWKVLPGTMEALEAKYGEGNKCQE